MRKIIYISTFLLVGIFFSCEGPKYFSVTIIDKTDSMPVDSVFVTVITKRGGVEQKAYQLSGYTDSSGKFISQMMIGTGLSLKKFDFYMNYSKKGYLSKTEENKTEGIVELERE